MADDTYDLAELCDAADVTARTVRYYVQQGLLPSPGARGPGARYDRGHLDRLHLIKRLQREHLPLAEIRARLAGLSDAAVAAVLLEPGRAGQHGSALEYVRDVLAGRPTTRREPGIAPHPAPTVPAAPAGHQPAEFQARVDASIDASAFDEADAVPGAPPHGLASDEADARRAEQPGPARSTWERIALAPDVELHVRRPLSRAQNKLVDRLIAHARTLLADPR